MLIYQRQIDVPVSFTSNLDYRNIQNIVETLSKNDSETTTQPGTVDVDVDAEDELLRGLIN